MANVCGDARGVGDIVEGETRNERVELHEESKGLTDPTGGAEDSNFAVGDGLRGKATAEDMGGGCKGGGCICEGFDGSKD